MDEHETLRHWHLGLEICHKAHFEAAAVYKRRHLLIGIPVVVLSSLVGTSVFASLDASPTIWMKVFVGFLSVTAAVLASLQTFLSYSELAEKHQAAAVKYGAIRREVEETLATKDPNNGYPREFFSSIRKRWDALDEESPVVPSRIYDPIATKFKEIWTTTSSPNRVTGGL